MHDCSSQLHPPNAPRFARRQFLAGAGLGLGLTALGSLFADENSDAPMLSLPTELPKPAAKAKRVIYLFQSGAPSQLELFDPKPELRKRHGDDLPDSVRQGQRLTTMTSGQTKFPIVANPYRFAQHGSGGTWISELLPHTASMADELCLVRTLHTEAINHDPAITFLTTGAQLAGRPSLGAWLSYGLGSENRDLPAFIAMISRGTGRPNDQPLYDRLWGSGFLPSRHQGVKFRSQGDPVLYLSNPPGIDRSLRRDTLDDLAALNRLHDKAVRDAEIETRIAQYELAFRMQAAVPELANLSDEPRHVLEMYGPDVQRPGSFAANCLLARRLSERGVRFVQLFHMGWDQHTNLPKQLPLQCRDVDQASAALLRDLKQRGLLDETLVVWGGEFGRTVYCQGTLTSTNFGRDHHPRCFSMWMAGGGVRGGMTYGETDDFSYNITRDPVHVHDLNATLLHLLGIDHKRLTYKFQGRHFRLTDVHGEVVRGLLS
ncbi:MAG: sulfatase [Pirellula sp.]|nr:sulfatase [Pirellula sp.]